MTYEIIVQLKKEVLDPEGRAIQETLGRLGFDALRGVTISKRYVLDLEESKFADSVATKDKAGQALAERIAKEFLANPVSETFQIRKL